MTMILYVAPWQRARLALTNLHYIVISPDVARNHNKPNQNMPYRSELLSESSCGGGFPPSPQVLIQVCDGLSRTGTDLFGC